MKETLVRYHKPRVRKPQRPFIRSFFLVQTIRKDKKKYYDELVEYSRKSLMLFPYHLSDIVVRNLNITPFHVSFLLMKHKWI